MPWAGLWLLWACMGSSCQKGPVQPENLLRADDGKIKRTPWLVAPEGMKGGGATWEGKIEFLGSRVTPEKTVPGGEVKLTTWYLLKKEILEDYQIFIHGTAAGAELNLFGDDHAPLDGLVPTSRWQVGEVIEENRIYKIPDPSPVEQLQFMGGFFKDQGRMRLDQRKDHDGKDRVLLGTVLVGEGRLTPEYLAPHTTVPMVVDGEATESDWARAPRVGPFINYDGHGVPSNRTFARLLWNAEALYVFFECEDKDIWTSFSKRDDPIYNEEAVEIFLDVDADTGSNKSDPNAGTYQELQCAPNEVHFDASFTGRRQGMNTGFNSSYETVTVLKGTLNDPTDQDEGWTSEWRIPWADLVDAKGGVRAGQKLKFNLFRLDKPRQQGRIVMNEASAWNSPLSGDFHNISRFGWLILQP